MKKVTFIFTGKSVRFCLASILIISASFFNIGAAQSTSLMDLATTNSTQSFGTYGDLTIAGNVMYGMTISGGTSGQGNIFSVNKDGSGYRDMHNFAANGSLKDIAQPAGSLTLSANGSVLYGMSGIGGQNNWGGIFSINTDGTGYQVLYSFNYRPTGGNGFGSLTRCGNMLYGLNAGGAKGFGCIFSFNLDNNTYTDMFDFNGANGWPGSVNSLIVSEGALYGMTEFGGANGDGCVFSFALNSSKYTDLMDFNNENGAHPKGNLTISGNTLYGMASEGGKYNNGVIFNITTDGSEYSNLLSFGGTNHGANPSGSLTIAGHVLYGMTNKGGESGQEAGNVFSVNTDGSGYSNVLDFNYSNGAYPQGSLTLIGNELYGMSSKGGANNLGLVFKCETTNTPASTGAIKVSTGEISVYPNPNNGIFTIASSVVSGQSLLEVYNALGQKVYSSLFSNRSSYDLSNQAGGIYFYCVFNESGSMTAEGKLVIQK